jgi:hypothetical protein
MDMIAAMKRLIPEIFKHKKIKSKKKYSRLLRAIRYDVEFDDLVENDMELFDNFCTELTKILFKLKGYSSRGGRNEALVWLKN